MNSEKTNIEEAKIYKPWLRFNIGDVVYHKSDFKKKCPIIIDCFLPFDEEHDYRGSWISSQKDTKSTCFHDLTLQ